MVKRAAMAESIWWAVPIASAVWAEPDPRACIVSAVVTVLFWAWRRAWWCPAPAIVLVALGGQVPVARPLLVVVLAGGLFLSIAFSRECFRQGRESACGNAVISVALAVFGSCALWLVARWLLSHRSGVRFQPSSAGFLPVAAACGLLLFGALAYLHEQHRRQGMLVSTARGRSKLALPILLFVVFALARWWAA